MEGDLWDEVKVLFGNDFNADTIETKYIRALYIVATPLEVNGYRYKDRFDRFSEQEEYYGQFFKRIQYELVEEEY